MPGVTEGMLARVMAVDFDTMAARSAAVAGRLDRAAEAHVTCPRGSDLQLDLRDREGIADDGRLTEPGAFGNLPCGEGFIAPRSGEGTMVASSLASLGLADEPARSWSRVDTSSPRKAGPEREFLSRLRHTVRRARTSRSSEWERTTALSSPG